MMTKRKLLLVIGAFILALSAIRMIWVALQATPHHPPIVKGMLDLRGFPLQDSRPLLLNGQWAFYPDRLIMNDASRPSASSPEPAFIQVPGSWNSSLASGSAYGYGSYRLRILVDPSADRTLAIRIQDISASSQIYVNGELVAQAGRPAENAAGYEASASLYTAKFIASGGVIDLVIQAANYDNPAAGGIDYPLLFGESGAVNRFAAFSIGMQLFLCVVLLIHAIYAVMLYIIGTRQKLLIYFSLANLSMILLTVLADDRVLLEGLPMTYSMYSRLINLAFLGIVVSLIRFCHDLLPEYSFTRFVRWYTIACVALALLFLVIPVQIVQALNLPSAFFEVLGVVAIWAIFLRATLRGVEDAIYLLLGITAVTANVLWSLLRISSPVEMYFYPVDLIVGFLAFAAFWFKRYFREAERTAKLALQLQRADKQKDDFLANTSHELRNPLHGMLNIARTVLDNGNVPLDEASRRNMELLITVGRRMSFMLNDLLDMNRLQESGMALNLKSLRLQAVASGVLDMLRFMTEGKPVRLSNDIPDTFPPVLADENRVIQILFNLLHNAVKYTNEGQVTISAAVHGGMAHISIEDTGIGMNEDIRERAFRPYEQGDSGMTAVGGGIGLGLSIGKQLAELHGGRLQIDRSVPGEGTVFSLTLPLARPSDVLAQAGQLRPDLRQHRPTAGAPGAAATLFPSETAAARPAETSDAPPPQGSAEPVRDRPRILAVDDDSINLSILSGLLSSERYEVVTAASGPEALSLLESGVWDLVVSDVMMPRMSGYELTRTIRGRFSVSELPILLLTARSRPEDIEAGFRAGANDYVTKPVEAAELQSRVRALTELKASVRERLRLEAAWLQAQIQPHFLFNTLNSIAALSELDATRMRRLLEAFGNYLRTSFAFANTEKFIPLKHELDLVRSYLFIEKERFKERLNIVWEVEADVLQCIPPLSIQPLVENAVRHGVCKRPQGGTVRIAVVGYPDHVEISVTDDGVGMSEETLRGLFEPQAGRKHGVGLLNTERRLRQLYGTGLRIESRPDAGTTVRFRIGRQQEPPGDRL